MQSLWNSLAVPQRLKLELPHDPLIPLPGMYQSEIKTHVHTKTCAWMHWLEMNCQIFLQQTWVYLGSAENYTSGPEAMVSCEPVTPEQRKEDTFTEGKGRYEDDSKKKSMVFHWLSPCRERSLLLPLWLCYHCRIWELPLVVPWL